MFFKFKPKEEPDFERLFNLYGNSLYKSAYNILCDHQLAENAVQETFLVILSDPDKLKEKDEMHIKNYLHVICRNKAKRIYRQKTKLNYDAETEERLETSIADAQDPAEIVINKEIDDRIYAAINALPEIYKDTLLMKMLYKLHNDEIARYFGISDEAVKKRLFRARKIIRTKLHEEAILWTIIIKTMTW